MEQNPYEAPRENCEPPKTSAALSRVVAIFWWLFPPWSIAAIIVGWIALAGLMLYLWSIDYRF